MKTTFIEGSAVIEGDEKATCRIHGVVIDYMYSRFSFCVTLVRTGNERVVGSFDMDEGGEREEQPESGKRKIPYVDDSYTRDEAMASATEPSKTRSQYPGNCKFVGTRELERSR